MTERDAVTPENAPDYPGCDAKRRDGGRCARPAGWGTSHPGVGSCKLHGGSTPGNVLKAERRLADIEANRLRGLLDAEPMTGQRALDYLEESGGRAAELERRVAAVIERLNALSLVTSIDEIERFERQIYLWAAVKKEAESAAWRLLQYDLASKRVRLEQIFVTWLLEQFNQALEAEGVDPATRTRIGMRYGEALQLATSHQVEVEP